MRPIHRILVPTDFSEHVAHAFELAADVAQRYDAEVILLHSYNVPGLTLPEGVVIGTAQALASLDALVERTLVESRQSFERRGVKKVRTKAVIGSPAQEIVREARELDVDLIIMGSHGRTGLSHALLGSVAQQVVRKAHCPVLVARPETAAAHAVPA
jgi:nucleotide-binding universal stress UspA family protein